MLLFLLFSLVWGVLLFSVKESHVKKQFIWLSMFAIWIYWGFSYINAPDTKGYMDFFDMLSTRGWVLDSLYGSAAGGMEPGTFVLMQLCKRVSDSYYFFQAVILMIDLGLSFWGLKKLLGNREQPVLFFLLFTFSVTLYLSALRQGVAVAIMVFCLPLFRENKFWIYIPLLFLAIFFHQSAILLFSIPVLIWLIRMIKVRDKAGKIILFIVFVICNICYLLGISIGDLIENALGGFVYDSSLSTNREMSVAGNTEESNFGILKVVEMDVIYLVFFFSKKNWKTESHYFLGAFFIVFFVLNMLVGGIVIHRLSYYLQIPYYFVLFESLRYLLIKDLNCQYNLSNLVIYLYMFALVVVQQLANGNYVFEYHLFDLL